MTADERERWDKKHLKEKGLGEASAFLQQIFALGLWPIGPGRALDIATGRGRNALFLAQRGFQVDAMDISTVGLREGRTEAENKGLTINFVQSDLDHVDLLEEAYDLILNLNFLHRSLIPKMKKALRVGGHILFETYLVDQRAFGHPKNPAYLLGHNELLEFFLDFRILYYREGKISEGATESYRAGLLGQKVTR